MAATVSPPDRSLEQRRQALIRANAIRSHRAVLKRDLKARRTSPSLIIGTPDHMTDSMKVFEVLLATPKIGRVKADKWLKRCRISPSKTLIGLSERQRSELLALLP